MIVDTAGLFPAGEGYVLEVSAIPEQVERKGYVFWNFTFSTEVEGGTAYYQESFPIWLAGPILKVLGFPEVTPGRFDVEPPEALGRRIKCDIVHEDVKGTPRARMKNMVAIVSAKDAPAKEEDSIPF